MAVCSTKTHRENRDILRELMLRNGFESIRTDRRRKNNMSNGKESDMGGTFDHFGKLSHFTLKDELYPDTYFDFPVRTGN